MEIDIHQLPIPNWDLACPRCQYSLNGLPQHRCPECGLQLHMDRIVTTATRLRPPHWTGHETPIPRCGLLCQTCRAPLDHLPALACGNCGAAVDPADYRPPREWFEVDTAIAGRVPLIAVEPLLAAEQIPFVREDTKRLREHYFGPEVASARLRVPSEFFFEVLVLLRRTEDAMDTARSAADAIGWICPKCHEGVPQHFEMCWNCGTAQPAAPTPQV